MEDESVRIFGHKFVFLRELGRFWGAGIYESLKILLFLKTLCESTKVTNSLSQSKKLSKSFLLELNTPSRKHFL
jgi:hypothetical protein